MSQQILAAAARLVATRGPEGFTMDDLAREAGVSRATLYRQVRSREAVLDALEAAGTPVGERGETRARILAAARVVFSRAGFDGATIEEIAAEAGVGLATVYRRFGDKERLIAAFLDELAPRKAARALASSPSGDLRADLERLAEQVLAGMRDDAPLVRLMMLETLRGGPLLPRVRALSPMRTLPAIAALLRHHAAAGRLRSDDTQALAQAFAGMLFSFGVMGPLVGGYAAPDPAATARLVADLFVRGALAPKEEQGC